MTNLSSLIPTLSKFATWIFYRCSINRPSCCATQAVPANQDYMLA